MIVLMMVMMMMMMMMMMMDCLISLFLCCFAGVNASHVPPSSVQTV